MDFHLLSFASLSWRSLLSDSYVNADSMQVDGGQAESKMMHTPGRNWGGKKMDYNAV